MQCSHEMSQMSPFFTVNNQPTVVECTVKQRSKAEVKKKVLIFKIRLQFSDHLSGCQA